MTRRTSIGPSSRWLLIACGPINLAGAVIFSPLFPGVRAAIGLPEAHPFYLWTLSAWVLAFGLAYVRQGWSGQINRSVLALGAWGKGVFALLVVERVAAGDSPPLALSVALPDLALAAVFASWLWQSRARQVRAELP